MATAHIESRKEDIAPIVLMPGDPLRAKYIAENFLEDAKLINKTRNMFGYTGTYKGKKVTVFASGMGIPSIGIYSYELFKFYDVEKIIRVRAFVFKGRVERLQTLAVRRELPASDIAIAGLGVLPAGEQFQTSVVVQIRDGVVPGVLADRLTEHAEGVCDQLKLRAGVLASRELGKGADAQRAQQGEDQDAGNQFFHVVFPFVIKYVNRAVSMR